MSLINPTVKQVLDLSWDQGRSYVRYLIQHNVRLNALSPAHEGVSEGLWSRRHHQLPCSAETRRKRVRLIESLCTRQDPICLLGDDDEVGLELIANGFEQVTVYDCDAGLLGRMRDRIPAEKQASIRLVQADVSRLEQLEAGFAHVVVFDPPYNYQGFMSFARAALHCARQDHPFHLIGMTVPEIFCNRSGDWSRILDFFRERSLSLKAHHKGFNVYPIARGSQWLLRTCAGILTPGALRSWRKPLHFFSDCLIWQHAEPAGTVQASE